MRSKVLLFSLLVAAGSLLPSPALAQMKSIAQDTVAFRRLLSDNFGYILDVPTLMRVYQRLANSRQRKNERLASDISAPGVFVSYPHSAGYTPGPFSSGGEGFSAGTWSMGLPSGTLDSARFPDSLRHKMKAAFGKYYWLHPDKEADKENLVRSLEAFDSLSINKPIFFATIHSTYGGNIRRYVDDLYKRSIMGNYRRLMRFCIRPTAKKLQKDLWVQFAIGLKLYNLWIERVRRGEITENEETRINQ